MLRKGFILAAILFHTLFVCAQNGALQTFTLDRPYPVERLQPPKGKKVRNVILMIGDGMSLMHIQAAWTVNHGHLWLENAAGKPLKSLVDYAKEAGKSAGIAVTCRLWDATPCDFISHNLDRDKEQDLVAEMINSPVDFVFGGGAKYFEKRDDNRNLFKELQRKGYHVSRSFEDLQQNVKSGKVYCVPFDVDTPLPDERGDLLARASLKGISLLNQNKKGFFMMIEGSQLDDYGHFNQLDMLMKETLDFDQTIGKIMQWAAKDGETLVVITADHETGGLTVHGGDLKTGTVIAHFSTKEHTGTIVPIYAFGPGSEQFTGFMDNTEVFWKIKKLLKI